MSTMRHAPSASPAHWCSRIGVMRSWPASPRSTRRSVSNAPAGARRNSASRSTRLAPTGCRSTGPPSTRRARRSSVRERSPTIRSTSWCPISTGRHSSRRGSCAAPTRRSSTTPGLARRLAICTATRSPCSNGSSARSVLTANAVVGFWPANTVGSDDIAVWCDETRKDALATFRTLRQQMAKPDGRPNVALADFVAPAETGVADYVGAFAVTTGPRPRRDRRRVRGRQRRLFGDPRQGPCRPARRGIRRATPRTRPARAVGLCPGRGPVESGPDRRAIPGHPAGARLSGLPGSHREEDALRPPRRRGTGRDHADRVVRHVAGRIGVSGTTSGTPPVTTSVSVGSVATSSPTTPRERASRSPTRSAGWRRIWLTTDFCRQATTATRGAHRLRQRRPGSGDDRQRLKRLADARVVYV